MLLTQRYVDRLIRGDELSFLADQHARRAGNDYPVFGAMMMILQRQLRAGPDPYALDLISLAAAQRIK